MKILIVGLVNNPQLDRLKIEGKKRGHLVTGCYASELTIYSDNKLFLPSLRGSDLSKYDLIYFWAVGKRRWEWYTTAHYLNKRYKTKIVNNKVIDPKYKLYLSPAMNYLKQVDEKLPFPKTAIIFNEKSIDSILGSFDYPLITKPSEGRQGRGVYLVKNIKELKKIVSLLLETSTSVVIREFIPNDGDIRVFTIGYKAIGAMKRTPKKGDFRSNISQGGKGSIFDLGSCSLVKDIAEKLSNLTATEVAGVDIILHKETKKPYILEINPGPQFTGFEKYTGINVAQKIIEYFESK